MSLCPATSNLASLAIELAFAEASSEGPAFPAPRSVPTVPVPAAASIPTLPVPRRRSLPTVRMRAYVVSSEEAA